MLDDARYTEEAFSFMTALIVLLVLVLVYFELPFWAQLIISVINFIVPDPIPIVDEVLMIVGMMKKLDLLEYIFVVLKYVIVLSVIVGLIALAAHFIIPHVSTLLGLCLRI